MAESKRPMDGPKERVLKGDTHSTPTPKFQTWQYKFQTAPTVKTIYLSHQTRGATWT